MRQSWPKRMGLAIAGLVLRTFGMRLNSHASLPANEYVVEHGPFRTAFPPPPDPPLYEPQPGFFERIATRSRVLSVHTRRLIVLCLLGAGVPLVVWGVYALFVGSVPELQQLPLEGWSFQRQQLAVNMPFSVSRWLDIPLCGLWAVFLGVAVSGMKAINWGRDESGMAFGFPWVGVLFACLIMIPALNEGTLLTKVAITLLTLISLHVFGLLSGILICVMGGFKQGFGAFLVYALPVWLLSEILVGPAGGVVFGLAAVAVGALVLTVVRVLVYVGSDG